MKKILSAIITFILISVTAGAADGFYGFEENNEKTIPPYEAPVIAASDMNDPKAPQRYEGIPNPFQAGNTSEGKFSFHQLSEGNYCTKITVYDSTATVKFPQPYMQHYEFSGRGFGKLTFDFDLMRDSTTKTLQASLLMKNIDPAQSGKSTTFVNISPSGDLTVPKVTNQENFDKYKKVPLNTWYKVYLAYDIDKGTFDCSINGDEIFSGVTKEELGVSSYSAYYCFRITHRTSTGQSGGDAYVDNICIRHNSGFDGVLLKGSALCKIGSSNAMSRRIGILVDRYNLSVQPFADNKTVYLPLRFTADSLHAKVEYNNATGDITLSRENMQTVLNVGNQSMKINGAYVAPANIFKLIDGVTYISAADITKALYTNVYYDSDGYVLITDYSGVQPDVLSMLGRHMDKEAGK